MSQINKLRQLGKSDLRVSPIGLGCWQFSKGKGVTGKYWPELPDTEIRDIVEVSLAGGINWFDTAEAYGWGESEKALSNVLVSLGRDPENELIATKWFPILRTAASFIKTIDQRLAALNVKCIDLHQIHSPLSFSSTASLMKAAVRLIEEKKIRYIGISNYSAAGMRKAHKELSIYDIPLISNQVEYNLLNRKIESNGVLDTAKELGISIIAYSPLAQGVLTGKFHEDSANLKKLSGSRKYRKVFNKKSLERSRPVITVLKELSEKYQASPSQIALNWVINFCGDTVVAIPGATSKKQAEANTNAMRFTLMNDELGYLDEVSTKFK